MIEAVATPRRLPAEIQLSSDAGELFSGHLSPLWLISHADPVAT